MQQQDSRMSPDSLTEGDIRFTPAAQAKLAEIMQQAEGVEAIRIFVERGGCSGMTYGMTYADSLAGDDSVASGPGYRVYIDAAALDHVRGCQVDFHDDGVRASFVFQNVAKSGRGGSGCGGCGGGGGSCGGR